MSNSTFKKLLRTPKAEQKVSPFSKKDTSLSVIIYHV